MENDRPRRMPNVPPFVKFVCANVPMVFDDSLSYYEALCALWKYVQGMTDVINNNATLEEEYIEKFNELNQAFNDLKTWIETYFDNLDVQEEINNKLDDMAENGTLATIITTYIQYITPEMYGAVGDGETDDSEAIQAAIDYANEHNKTVFFGAKTYLIESALNVYSGMELHGNGATIMTSGDIPAFTAESVVSKVYIHDFNLTGGNDETLTNNKAINLVCYYSKFENIFALNFYDGLYLDTTGADGTLVENRVDSCRFGGYYRYGIYVGANGNGKLTDGFMTNVICNGNTNSTADTQMGIYIGSSAGWVVNGVHVYGKNTHAISIANTFNTNLNNLYIEGFSTYGLAMGSAQMGANVSNVFINHYDVSNTGTAIRIEGSGYLPSATHAGNLSNIRIRRGNSSAGKSISCTTDNFNASNVIIDGATRTLDNDCSGVIFTMNGLIDVNDYNTKKQVSTLGLTGNIANSYIQGYKFFGFSPSTTSITIPMPTFTKNNQEGIIRLTGIGGQYTTQSGLFYDAFIQIVYATDHYVARIKNVLYEPFNTEPTIAVDAVNQAITLTIDPKTNIYGNIFWDVYQTY